MKLILLGKIDIMHIQLQNCQSQV